MVSGSKDNSRNKKKGKQKLVLAKDKKQATIALVVLGLFLLNSVYMVAKNFMAQHAQPVTTSASQQATTDPLNPNRAINDPTQNAQNAQNPNPNPTTTSVDSTKTSVEDTNKNLVPPQAVAPPAGINPLLPIILFILLIAGVVVYVLYKYLKKQKSVPDFLNPQQGSSSLNKKGKQKVALAKNPKQAALAIIVLCLFLGNTLYMIVRYFMIQNRSAGVPQQTAETLAQQQQQNLEMLNGGQPIKNSGVNVAQDANNIYSQTVNLQGNSPANPQINSNAKISQTPESDVEIMSTRQGQTLANSSTLAKKREKMVLISVADSGRSNPFLPAGENFLPSSLPRLNSNLLAPPETLPINSEAGKVMTTTISGILYDKYSPSAIINIEGADYLVKRGDIINHYKILSIGKTEVIVQLGKNVYKAGVGELLSQTNLNYNTIANLNKKFGGNEVQVNVKKKGY